MVDRDNDEYWSVRASDRGQRRVDQSNAIGDIHVVQANQHGAFTRIASMDNQFTEILVLSHDCALRFHRTGQDLGIGYSQGRALDVVSKRPEASLHAAVKRLICQ